MGGYCPLYISGTDQQIPDMCREQCGQLWEKASAEQPPSHNEFSYSNDENSCQHTYSEAGAETLHIGEGAERFYSLNEDCLNCGIELGGDT